MRTNTKIYPVLSITRTQTNKSVFSDPNRSCKCRAEAQMRRCEWTCSFNTLLGSHNTISAVFPSAVHLWLLIDSCWREQKEMRGEAAGVEIPAPRVLGADGTTRTDGRPAGLLCLPLHLHPMAQKLTRGHREDATTLSAGWVASNFPCQPFTRQRLKSSSVVTQVTEA